MSTTRFELLLRLFGDEETEAIFSEEGLVRSWLDTEVALATAQAELDIVEPASAAAIAQVARVDNIDLPALWSASRIVGYPILPLVNQIEAALPVGHRGRVHFGATTQDIMDTGLALQLRAAGARQLRLLREFGDQLAALSQRHETTVMAARTHAQQAVPSVLGAKFAVYLSEVARDHARLTAAYDEAVVVSLFGAGGSSASYGPRVQLLRARGAELLGLRTTDVPWHVARDRLANLAAMCVAVSSTAARFAHEVIDLSRPEIGELAEADGHLQGASSTMPQKHNPINCEAIIGAAATAQALAPAMFRAMEAGHERSAGEWQIEWQTLPQLVCLASSAVGNAALVASGLQVFPARMHENLRQDGGLLVSEAYMMLLAAVLGRSAAHDLVYEAAREVRRTGLPLVEVLRAGAPASCQHLLAEELGTEHQVGHPRIAMDAALREWHDCVSALSPNGRAGA
jgi:3-carboxy-cis,cis-muconate cycloisomerase